MTRGVRWYLVGSFVVLVALAGCKPGWIEEREPWRHEAEETCLKSGGVKEGPSVVMLGPINGPGMCGADFPLKVSTLGEGAPLAYTDEPLRPPGEVRQGGPVYPSQSGPTQYPAQYPQQYPPQYPQQYPSQYPPNTPFAVNPNYPHDTRLPPRQLPPTQQNSGAPYGAPPSVYHAPPAYPPNTDYRPSQTYEPSPPVYRAPPAYPPNTDYRPPQTYEPSPPYSQGETDGPVSLSPPGIVAPGGDRQGEYQTPLPRYGAPPGAPRTVPPREEPYRPDTRSRSGPFSSTYPGGGQTVPLSSSRQAALVTTASVSPPATLACPIVSALDRWIADAVQPAAQKWFGQPVTGIRQISAYSCRGMNGNPNAHISEHAFGNALDIASFELADGRKITVERGWHGAPEEQGFLRDVQAAACELFTTVLAPGSNVYHYNHIHVDLMRRANGGRICQPGAVAGDIVAARARERYASRAAAITGSVARGGRNARHPAPYSSFDDENDKNLPEAIAGED